MKKILTDHCASYPLLEIQDIFKFLHQSSFGCEHMVSSYDEAAQRIKNEFEHSGGNIHSFVEPLCGKYSRVWLGYIKAGMSPHTLAKLFYLSAKKKPDGLLTLEENLKSVRILIEKGILHFDTADFDRRAEAWRADGYPALHHSESFREAYNPAYRVISNEFVPFLPLFSRLDSMLSETKVRLCIEGGSASGKTTLSALLEKLYDCTVFHMDDFFLQPYQRTPERFAQPGGNVDRERFLKEVLVPMDKGETVQYRRFDCSTFKITQPVAVVPKKLVVTEGAYSMHPELSGYYDLSVFLDISTEVQKKRITKRNPDMAHRFFDEWIPLEKRYFEAFDIENKCDIRIPIIM